VQRTSLSHPLQIAELSVGTAGGAIGVTFAPGKCQQMAMTGSWDRDLDIDLRSIVVWGAEYLLSLLEPWEFEELHIQELPQRAKALGLNWHGLPIIDGAAPDSRFMSAWESTGSLLSNELLQGRKAVVHCKGGLGRAGTVAAMLLLQTGSASSAEQAIARVRQVRPGAVETMEQEDFVVKWSTCARAGHN